MRLLAAGGIGALAALGAITFSPTADFPCNVQVAHEVLEFVPKPHRRYQGELRKVWKTAIYVGQGSFVQSIFVCNITLEKERTQ